MKLNAAILFAALSVSAAASDSAGPGVRTLKNDKKSKSSKSSKNNKKAKSNTVPVPPPTAPPIPPATVAPVAPPPVCEGSPYQYQGDVPLYAFNSKFTDGSSVAYSGQTARQLLVGKMKDAIGDVVTGKEPGVNRDLILKYYACESQSDCDDASPGIDVDPLGVTQNSIDDVGSVSLVSKIAGNDVIGPHKDWEKEFVGWDDWGAEPFEIKSPDNLVRHWANVIDDMALQNDGTDPSGNAITKLYVSPQGQDYQQLIQKFVLGAVTFSQAADDYLDDDLPDKGLNADNSGPKTGKTYSSLEHAWDEGYGYWGAARDYGQYLDIEIAVKGGREGWSQYHDTNGDEEIDLTTEHNFGFSINAAKRDYGSSSCGFDLTGAAYYGFFMGRALITEVTGALSEDQMDELLGYRNIIIESWEKAIAATVIHYINDCIDDITGETEFYDYAKHWSEAKGFALSFQFNRLSPVSDEDFEQLHTLLRDAPELDPSEFNEYEDDLLTARDILEEAFGFDSDDVRNW